MLSKLSDVVQVLRRHMASLVHWVKFAPTLPIYSTVWYRLEQSTYRWLGARLQYLQCVIRYCSLALSYRYGRFIFSLPMFNRLTVAYFISPFFGYNRIYLRRLYSVLMGTWIERLQLRDWISEYWTIYSLQTYMVDKHKDHKSKPIVCIPIKWCKKSDGLFS